MLERTRYNVSLLSVPPPASPTPDSFRLVRPSSCRGLLTFSPQSVNDSRVHSRYSSSMRRVATRAREYCLTYPDVLAAATHSTLDCGLDRATVSELSRRSFFIVSEAHASEFQSQSSPAATRAENKGCTATIPRAYSRANFHSLAAATGG